MGYCRSFIKGYTKIVTHFTNLLKKASFNWSFVTNEYFLALKQVMVSTPVLVLPNFSEPLILEIDTSRSGVGVVLSQHNHPITCFSKKLSS